jgi:RND family efflux transporter MFP subunit
MFHAAICSGMLLAAATAPAQSDRASGQADASLKQYEGLVLPCKEVQCSAPFSSRLKSVPVEEGERVEAGQLLARLEDRVREKQVKAAKVKADQSARIEQAEAALKQAKLKVKRLEKAYKADAASEWELQQAKASVEQAKAKRAVAEHRELEAKAELALARVRLQRRRLEAPFTGTVKTIEMSEGATLTGQNHVLTLVKLDPLEAELNLPVALYGQWTEGKQYRLQAGEPVNDTVIGKLTHVSPVIDSASRTFSCVFEIDNPEGDELPAGFTVHLASFEPVKKPGNAPTGKTAANAQSR